MKTTILVKKLERLPDLHKQIRHYHTGDRSEWVALGLLTEEEMQERDEHSRLHARAHQAKEEAEEQIDRPDIMPHYPPEYRALAERAAALKTILDADKEVRDTIRTLMPSRSFGDRSIPWGISRLAGQVWERYSASDSPERTEYDEIRSKMDNKERVGSKVLRIRQEIWGTFNREREATGNKAYQAVLSEHQDIVDRYNEIDRLINKRRKEETDPLYREIAAILKSVL